MTSRRRRPPPWHIGLEASISPALDSGSRESAMTGGHSMLASPPRGYLLWPEQRREEKELGDCERRRSKEEEISEGLTFLHSGVKMVHGNLCLENIILNKSGAWKIMGFDFSISSINPSDAEKPYIIQATSTLTTTTPPPPPPPATRTHPLPYV
ncbi:hypothetical protein CRUP_031540 [Coryphaenoides rupestris]|nr:hypothetical protein CRUP_031540 [Coryphaenoides rupestris]